MLLVLDSAHEPRRLWLTRRAWLALYRQLSAVAPDPGAEAQPQPPPSRPTRMEPGESEGALFVDAVRVVRRDDSVRIAFRVGPQAVSLNLPSQGVAQLQRMVEIQAERAGWDPQAALGRLAAGAVAQQAVRRAQE